MSLLKLQEPFFLYDQLSILRIFEVVMNPRALLHLSPVITVIAFIWSVCWDIIFYPSFSISKLPFNNTFMHFQNNYDNPDKKTAKPFPSLLLQNYKTTENKSIYTFIQKSFAYL